MLVCWETVHLNAKVSRSSTRYTYWFLHKAAAALRTKTKPSSWASLPVCVSATYVAFKVFFSWIRLGFWGSWAALFSWRSSLKALWDQSEYLPRHSSQLVQSYPGHKPHFMLREVFESSMDWTFSKRKQRRWCLYLPSIWCQHQSS